jgi:hypothetical protein
MLNHQFTVNRPRRWQRIGDSTCALFLVGALAWLGGCTIDLSPEAVADRFWRGVITNHPEKVRRYVRAIDQSSVSGGFDIGDIAEKQFGRMLVNGDKATVETRLTLAGDSPLNISIDTRLVRENGQWRVDYQRTMDELSQQAEVARIVDQIHQIGEKLKLAIDHSVGELTEVVPKLERELSRLESDMKEGLPKLRQRIEEFSKQMEEALKQAPRQPDPPASKPSLI